MDRPTASQRAAIRHRESSKYAPSYKLPHHALISIEHPFIIKNTDKAIQTLGGLQKMKALVQEKTQPEPAQLYLHPDDPMSNPISSSNVKTNNVVLQVTVPKRTGLKRRRGVLGPYHEGVNQSGSSSSSSSPVQCHNSLKSIRYVLRSLRDNTERYTIQPIGAVHITHRFRDMPDFVYSTTNGPFITKIREHILPFEYEKLKKFTFDMSKGPQPNIDLVPPPRWSHVRIPFNYAYLQSSSSKPMLDEFGVMIESNHKPLSARNQAIPHDGPAVPARPVEDLPPLAVLEPAMRRLIESARLLFDERPIWTRRALHNRVSAEDLKVVGSNSAKYMYQYLGYLFDSGPWRDAIIKFGVDPRKDPSLRSYQTMMFMLDKDDIDKKKQKASKLPRFGSSKLTQRDTHIFDGKTVSLDGKVWQVCDITDPLLSAILSTIDIRDECHTQSDGWYHSGTWAKAKTIMKFKITTLLAGEVPNDSDYMRVVNEIPEIIDNHNMHLAHFPRKTATPLEVKLAYQVRNAAKNYQWTMSQGISTAGDRLSKYGYRRNDNEAEELDMENEAEDDDDEFDEFESEVRGQEEEEQQGAMERDEHELGLDDVESLEEDKDLLGDGE